MRRVQQIADCEQLLGSLQHLGVSVLSRTQPDVWPVKRQSCVTRGSGLMEAANTQALRAALDPAATLRLGMLFSHPE